MEMKKRKIIVLIGKKEGWFGFERYWLITNGYYCKKCDYEILYSKQKEIKKVQDIYSSRVLVNGNTLVKNNKVQKFKDKHLRSKNKNTSIRMESSKHDVDADDAEEVVAE